MYSKLIIIGNIGSDAELRYLPESPNDTQTDTFVYGKDSKPLPCPFCGEIVKECNDVATPIDVALRKRIAELEGKIRHNALWQASEDAEERAHLEKLVPDLKKRFAELEGFIDRLVEAGDAMSNAQSMWVAEEDKWNALVKDWKER